MKLSSLVRVLGAAAAGMLLLPVLATDSTAAAARLEVTASPLQTWKIVDGLPALPVPDVRTSPPAPAR